MNAFKVNKKETNLREGVAVLSDLFCQVFDILSNASKLIFEVLSILGDIRA